MVQALQETGFAVTHVRGSHHYLRRSDGARLVVVPVHGNRDLPGRGAVGPPTGMGKTRAAAITSCART